MSEGLSETENADTDRRTACLYAAFRQDCLKKKDGGGMMVLQRY